MSNISFNLKKIGRRGKIRRTIILVDTSCITKNIATVGKTGCASNRAHACMLAYTRAEIHFHLSHTPHTPRPGQTAKQLVATPVDPSQLLRNPWLNFSRRILGEKPPSTSFFSCIEIIIFHRSTILVVVDFYIGWNSPISVHSLLSQFDDLLDLIETELFERNWYKLSS